MEGYPVTIEHEVVFHDIDMLGHVNNVQYAVFFETARIEYVYQAGGDLRSLPLIIAELNIGYKSQAFLRERLEIGVRITEIRNTSIILECLAVEKESRRVVATNRCVLVHFDYETGRPSAVPQEWRERFSQLEGRPL